jgi:tetratricopeptide (TPR) repeat protein
LSTSKGLERIIRAYQTVLSGKKALILLDNAASREQVEPLLPPPGSVLVVTSRIKFAVPCLIKEMDLDPGLLPLGDANMLLLKICGRIGDHAEKLAELCGCLPIALRNAAYALKEKPNLSLEGYLERLGDATKRLELVEASFSTSYELLSPELQRLWSMLSVFPADYDLDGAAAVWEMEKTPTEDALGDLIKWSLIDFLPPATGKGGRYKLHDLARDFAGSHLEADERYLAQQSHSKHYQELLWRANNNFLAGGDSQLKGLIQFEVEWINIEAGQRYAAINSKKSHDIADICSNYSGAWQVLDLRLHPRTYTQWLEEALIAAREIKNKAAECAHLGNLGIVFKDLGDHRKAIEYYNQALKISKEIGNRLLEGNMLGNLGNTYSILSEIQRAIDSYELALKISREIGNHKGEASSLGGLGSAYILMGQPDKAIEYYDQSHKIFRDIGDLRSECINLCNLGMAHYNLNEPRKAVEYYKSSLRIACDLGDRRSEGLSLFNMSLSLNKLGQRESAIDQAQSALAIFEQIESPHAEAVRKKLAEWGA